MLHIKSQLELLPTEIHWMIVDLLRSWDIKPLSCVNKQLREVHLPFLFCQVNVMVYLLDYSYAR